MHPWPEGSGTSQFATAAGEFVDEYPLDPSKLDPKELENDCESEKLFTVMVIDDPPDIYLLRRHFESTSL